MKQNKQFNEIEININLAEKSHLHGMGSSYSQAVTELDLAI